MQPSSLEGFYRINSKHACGNDRQLKGLISSNEKSSRNKTDPNVYSDSGK